MSGVTESDLDLLTYVLDVNRKVVEEKKTNSVFFISTLQPIETTQISQMAFIKCPNIRNFGNFGLKFLL